jgi:Mg2+ and Co2+ transporter CorA
MERQLIRCSGMKLQELPADLPPNSWGGGFWYAIGLMALSVIGLWIWFRRAGWF